MDSFLWGFLPEGKITSQNCIREWEYFGIFRLLRGFRDFLDFFFLDLLDLFGIFVGIFGIFLTGFLVFWGLF